MRRSGEASAEPPRPPGSPPTLLTIEELSRRSGVAEAQLARWEREHAFPERVTEADGRPLYAADDAQLLRQAFAEQAAGASLGNALAAARSAGWAAGQSVFFAVRRAHPELTTHVLAKRAVLAICRAIEDEAHRSAVGPVLVAGFQREPFYRASERRWRGLAASAHTAVVFADFDGRGDPLARPAEVSGTSEDPFIREWFVLCHAPDLRAMVTTWERPSAPGAPDAARTFETLWTTNPIVVATAFAAARARLEAHSEVLAADVRSALGDPGPPVTRGPSADELLAQRVVAYLAASAR